jgi:hypothetical protein
MPRSAYEIFEDHLNLAESHDIDTDLRRNWAKDVVILSSCGVYYGHEGARELFNILEAQLPHAKFQYNTILVEREVAFLEWTAQAGDYEVRDGVDSYVIRNGLFVAQTIHYTLTRVGKTIDHPDEEDPSWGCFGLPRRKAG